MKTSMEIFAHLLERVKNGDDRPEASEKTCSEAAVSGLLKPRLVRLYRAFQKMEYEELAHSKGMAAVSASQKGKAMSRALAYRVASQMVKEELINADLCETTTEEMAMILAAEVYANRNWHHLGSSETKLVDLLTRAGYLTPCKNGFTGHLIARIEKTSQ